MLINEIDFFYPKTQTEWRLWLQKNHSSSQSVWLVFYKKKTGKPTITWSQSVDEALCFGWIDSVQKKSAMARSCEATRNKTKSNC